MAPPESDQDTSLEGETLEKPVVVQDGEASYISPATSLTTFHGYMHLPFELRAQIRTAAIKSAYPNPNPWKWPDLEKPCSRLATVSKEWQDDVERALFCQIRIDPCDEVDVAKFKGVFTDERKRFLMRLDIAIDDEESTSPWHEEMGLLRISQVMEKVGQFFHYINSWEFCREGEKQQCIDIVFTTLHQNPGHHDQKYEQPHMAIRSLWEQDDFDLLTRRGLVPSNMALWAVKSEFPSSLNMVTHLTFLPDCVPFPAAQKIIQTMPNLETCVLEVRFSSESEEGWKHLTGRIPPALSLKSGHETDAQQFTDFIHQLRISAPSLRKLMLHSQDYISRPFVPPSMKKFAATLRDFSQGLEILRAEPFDLHHAFFLQSSEGLNPAAATSQWSWPRLQQLELRGFSQRSDFGADQLTVTATDILIAAGTAATAMPALEIAEIEIEPQQYFYIKREPCKEFKGFRNAFVILVGFHEGEEQRILTAWAHFIGGEARLVEQKIYDDGEPPMRRYGAVVKEEATS